MATWSGRWRAALATGLVTLTVGCGPRALPSTAPQDVFDTSTPSPSSSANPTDSPIFSSPAAPAPLGGTDINPPGSTPTTSATMPRPATPLTPGHVGAPSPAPPGPAAACPTFTFTNPGTHTVTVTFVSPSTPASGNVVLVGAGGGGGRGPGPGGTGTPPTPGGPGGGGAGGTIDRKAEPVPDLSS
jgi:hypothetical protein